MPTSGSVNAVELPLMTRLAKVFARRPPILTIPATLHNVGANGILFLDGNNPGLC